MKKRFVGNIVLSEAIVLDWLGYKGGTLLYFGRSEEHLGILAMIEHQDMPEVEEGGMVSKMLGGPRGIYWDAKDSILIRVFPGKRLHHHVVDMFRLLKYYWSLVGLQKKYSKSEKL